MVRKSNTISYKGFTIVELTIVIVVISILAAITVIAYNSVREETISTTLKDDLRNGSSKIESYRADHGGYPSSIYDLNDGEGIQATGGNYYYYVTTASGYCIEASSEDGEFMFSLDSDEDIIVEDAPCPVIEDL